MPEPCSHATEGQTTDPPTFVERRRPGRVEYSSPQLIEMMRGETRLDPSASLTTCIPFENLGSASDDGDNLSAARGILTGVLLALPLWALIGAGAWFLLRG
jgi:hypothetical protein